MKPYFLLVFLLVEGGMVKCEDSEAESEPTAEKSESTTNPSAVDSNKDMHDDDIGMFPMNASTSFLRCGEIMNTSTGGIFYKPFENLQENERCAWTIAVPSASGYKVNVQYLGINTNPNLNRLFISGFKKGNNETIHSIPTKTGEIVISPVTFIVVVFHTGSIVKGQNETGFALQYTTIYDSQSNSNNRYSYSYVSSSSKHYMLATPTFNLQHPRQSYSYSSNWYNSNEFTSFIFAPKDNLFRKDQRSIVMYKKDSVKEYMCADHLRVYFFCPRTTEWHFKGKICGSVDMQLIRNNDLTLVIFETDSSSEGYGFQFNYM